MAARGYVNGRDPSSAWEGWSEAEVFPPCLLGAEPANWKYKLTHPLSALIQILRWNLQSRLINADQRKNRVD